MLIALIVGYLFLGGAAGVDLFTKDDRAAVKTVITEQERAKEIVDLMKALDKSATKKLKPISKQLKAWSKADRDHSLGRESLDPVIEQALAARADAQAEFLDGLFELKAKMSRQEWDAVFNN
jgi:hypothetical protein